jgi:hypothetical protein
VQRIVGNGVTILSVRHDGITECRKLESTSLEFSTKFHEFSISQSPVIKFVQKDITCK